MQTIYFEFFLDFIDVFKTLGNTLKKTLGKTQLSVEQWNKNATNLNEKLYCGLEWPNQFQNEKEKKLSESCSEFMDLKLGSQKPYQ